jgi:hypothetical protein
MELVKRLDEIGFERTRRAVAALPLSLFVFLYLIVSASSPELAPALLALSACYAVAFFGVVAEWFWARWYASGLGWSGVMVAVFGFTQLGWSPALAIYGALHGIVVLALMGTKMAARYDMQEAWRKRFEMDDLGVARLRKTVTRAAASLPGVILMALGPKEPGQGMLLAGAGVVTALLAVAGLRGVIRMRSWGLLALAASTVLLFATGGSMAAASISTAAVPSWLGGVGVMALAPYAAGVCYLFPAVLLASALLPFVQPAARFLARRS